MKKMVLLAMAALFVAGTAMGQTAKAKDILGDDDSPLDALNVIQTESVEYHLTRSVYRSMIDDFIDVNYYDPDVGTFVFLGGFYDNQFLDGTKVSFGLGKTLNNSYIGLYYGGTLVNSSGSESKTDAPKDADDSVTSTTAAAWDSTLALLLGTSNLGAFRVDLKFQTVHSKTINNKAVSESFNPGALIGLTWGGISLNGLSPYITLGTQLPTHKITTALDVVNDKNSYTLTESTGGFFGIQLGVEHDDGIWGDLALKFKFDDISKGEIPRLIGGSEKIDIVDGTTDGGFLAGLRIGYDKIWEIEKLSFGIGPELKMGFGSFAEFYKDNANKNNPLNVEIKDSPNNANFQLLGLLNFGLKFQISEKFDLYTGGGINIFDWQVGGYTYKPKNSKDTYTGNDWTLDGISWAAPTLFNFGLTFKPIEGLVIGTDISSIFNRFISVDPATMKATTGFADTGANNIGDWSTSFIRGINLNLTISYQFSSGGRSASE